MWLFPLYIVGYIIAMQKLNTCFTERGWYSSLSGKQGMSLQFRDAFQPSKSTWGCRVELVRVWPRESPGGQIVRPGGLIYLSRPKFPRSCCRPDLGHWLIVSPSGSETWVPCRTDSGWVPKQSDKDWRDQMQSNIVKVKQRIRRTQSSCLFKGRQ